MILDKVIQISLLNHLFAAFNQLGKLPVSRISPEHRLFVLRKFRSLGGSQIDLLLGFVEIFSLLEEILDTAVLYGVAHLSGRLLFGLDLMVIV